MNWPPLLMPRPPAHPQILSLLNPLHKGIWRLHFTYSAIRKGLAQAESPESSMWRMDYWRRVTDGETIGKYWAQLKEKTGIAPPPSACCDLRLLVFPPEYAHEGSARLRNRSRQEGHPPHPLNLRQ